MWGDPRHVLPITLRSKRKYFWMFQIGGVGHTLELFHSILNGKKTLLLDNKSLFETQPERNPLKRLFNRQFRYCFSLSGLEMMVEQEGADFDFRVNGRYFREVTDATLTTKSKREEREQQMITQDHE